MDVKRGLKRKALLLWTKPPWNLAVIEILAFFGVVAVVGELLVVVAGMLYIKLLCRAQILLVLSILHLSYLEVNIC